MVENINKPLDEPKTGASVDKNRRKKKKRISRGSLIRTLQVCLMALLGGAIVFGAAYYVTGELSAMEQRLNREMEQEVSSAIRELREENTIALNRLEESIEQLESELVQMGTLLEDADQSLDISASTSRELSGQIEELERHLLELEESLEVLRQRP